ncbi:N-acetyltransferase [Antarcticibacterium flavum]|uniref:N-acetyltransferase n=1 Tax=Antarcticibacterium flavum TaxID=2058175 RepID=A0A5B7X331_9FLAO|nr:MULTISPECIES: GNAT family N-acetyltransferase [Antarcticibacterium]MCM4160170.1 GNAT family N-acetyltransferase [Antarcticibacterium sp. W02-3]QCY69719.1 N-acetyltransferase [Antarcticibacterium flavum]
MQFQNSNSEARGVITAKDRDKEAGKINYSISEEQKLTIEHTEVDPDYQGQGVGKKLVDEATDFARKNNMKIIPKCPYARKIMERADKYKDVLA